MAATRGQARAVGVSPRLYFDFPDGAGERQPLTFTRPRELLVATRPAEVGGVLRRAEACAKAGAWVAGFVCYEAAAAFDPAFRFGGRGDLPLAWFAVCDAPLPGMAPPAAAAGVPPSWTASVGRHRYARDIRAIQQRIAAGDAYQVNHTIRLHSPWAGDPQVLFQRLHAAHPGGYGACLDLGRFHILSLSPELFFRREGDRVTTRPMKGTARRGASPAEDRRLAEGLLASAKERAENLMIVDLLRNDLSRLALPRTVEVPALFALEGYPSVWQMTSTVRCRLRPEVDLVALFAALFPCGSITGAPKIKAMEIIAGLEGEARGIYCGAVGFLRPGGDAVFNVAIRTLLVDTLRQEATYGVGGGITADSTAAGEYAEVLAKSRMLRAGGAVAT